MANKIGFFNKIYRDLLETPEGKLSRKSLTWAVSFFVALMYGIFIPMVWEMLFDKQLHVSETIVITLFTFVGAIVGVTEVGKKFTSKPRPKHIFKRKYDLSEDTNDLNNEKTY